MCGEFDGRRLDWRKRMSWALKGGATAASTPNPSSAWWDVGLLTAVDTSSTHGRLSTLLLLLLLPYDMYVLIAIS